MKTNLKNWLLTLALPVALALGGISLPHAAYAGDDSSSGSDDSSSSDDDSLDDILKGGKKDESVKQETEDVKKGKLDDTVGADQVTPPGEEKGSRRIIKVLQKKNFLKIGRYEASPNIGFVTNDPFINRYLIGAAFAYHVTEIFAVEFQGDFSPDFGEGDWKPITKQLVNNNKVSPDISKISYYGNINFQFSPIYGKVAVSGKNIINFDIFGTFGTGIVNTQDDLDALQCSGEADCEITKSQFHPTTNFGGGLRIIFSKSLALRLEGRSMVYIETIESTTLEMKNNFMLLGSVSFFFPGMD